MVAYICPIYDMKNHFELGIQLAKSYIQYKVNADFYFVFSNKLQQEKFFLLLGEYANNFSFLILPDSYQHYKGKVITKKFYALKYLMNHFEYLVMVDVESKFIKKFDSKKLCDDIWNSHNTLVSNKSYDGFFIQRSCYKTMEIYNNKKLRKETGCFLYNYWFNELQVYKSDALKDFFIWIEQFNTDKILDEPRCFEYYVFAAYLILEKGWHLKKKNYYSWGGINEYLFLYPTDIGKKILKELGTHWSSSSKAENDNTVMLFHLDRKSDYKDYIDNSFMKKMKCIFKRYMILILRK